MAACDDKLPPKPAGGAEGPDVKDVIACVRGHGVDAPDRPGRVQALARGLGGLERRGRRPARLQDEPGPRTVEGPVKPGGCVNDVRPADGGAKPDARREAGRREPGI